MLRSGRRKLHAYIHFILYSPWIKCRSRVIWKLEPPPVKFPISQAAQAVNGPVNPGFSSVPWHSFKRRGWRGHPQNSPNPGQTVVETKTSSPSCRASALVITLLYHCKPCSFTAKLVAPFCGKPLSLGPVQLYSENATRLTPSGWRAPSFLGLRHETGAQPCSASAQMQKQNSTFLVDLHVEDGSWVLPLELLSRGFQRLWSVAEMGTEPRSLRSGSLTSSQKSQWTPLF